MNSGCHLHCEAVCVSVAREKIGLDPCGLLGRFFFSAFAVNRNDGLLLFDHMASSNSCC